MTSEQNIYDYACNHLVSDSKGIYSILGAIEETNPNLLGRKSGDKGSEARRNTLAATPKQRFQLRSPAEVAQAFSMDWAVHGIFPSKGLVAIYGASRSGKTFISLHLAAMLALGLSWFGKPVPTTRRVIYVALEGQWGMPLRLLAWAETNQKEFPHGVSFVFEAFSINCTDDVTTFANWVKEEGGADVIICDTLNRAAPGADENRSADMGKIIAGASLLRELTDSLVILVHHAGKDESRGLRGHSSLLAALDAVIEVKREPNNMRSWRLDKAKDGEDGISHSFELVSADLGVDDYGLPITSVAVRELDTPVPSNPRQKTLGKNQQIVLAQIKLLISGLAMTDPSGSDALVGINFDQCIKHCKDHIEAKDERHKTERVKDAIRSLIKLGYIVESNGVIRLP